MISAVRFLGQARRYLCDLLSALELLPRNGVELSLDTSSDQPYPLDKRSPFHVLKEVSATGLIDLHALVERFLEGMMTDCGRRSRRSLSAFPHRWSS